MKAARELFGYEQNRNPDVGYTMLDDRYLEKKKDEDEIAIQNRRLR